MNKKFIVGMFAVAGLLATSCSSDDDRYVIAPENAAQVSFDIKLEGATQTRAISDATGVDKLVYAVYDADGDIISGLDGVVRNGQFIKEGAFTDLKESVAVTLAKGQEYTVLFWAQDGDCAAYNTNDLENVTVSYDNAANNDETRDAFYAAATFTVNGNQNVSITMKRPFAQVNLGVTAADWNAAEKATVVINESKVVVKQAATTINLKDGSVDTPVDVTYDFAAIPTEVLAVDLDGDGTKEEYKYLSMSYILVDDASATGAEKATAEFAYTFSPVDGADIEFNDGLATVPVQRNYRTNIVGTILTGEVTFDITIDPIFDGENVIDADLIQVAPGVYKRRNDDTKLFITEAVGLDYISEKMGEEDGFAGKTITLMNDIDCFKGYMSDGDPVTTEPLGSTGERDGRNRLICEPFKGTFDGGGHTIENLYQNGWAMGYEWGQYGSIGLFAELEDATVKNVVIEGMNALVEGGDISFITGSATGICVFEDIEIKNSSIGTYNNGMGGIIGWSGAGTYTFKNIKLGSDVVLGGLWGSFDSSIGGIVGQAEPGATYNFENVEINCRIDAYNDVTAAYDYGNYRMCGMIIGRCAQTTTIGGANYPDLSQYNITCTNVTVNYGTWMNYHYCNKQRVEAGYAYGGIPEDADHSGHTTRCLACIPFDQLIGGAQYGVKGLREVAGVTVNYPTEYTCTLCGKQHNN